MRCRPRSRYDNASCVLLKSEVEHYNEDVKGDEGSVVVVWTERLLCTRDYAYAVSGEMFSAWLNGAEGAPSPVGPAYPATKPCQSRQSATCSSSTRHDTWEKKRGGLYARCRKPW